MQPILLFTACSAGKDDSYAISAGARVVTSDEYLDDPLLREELRRTREEVLSDPRARRGQRTTLALDLYVHTGRAYGDLRRRSDLLAAARTRLQEGTLQWFFLSGGYGVLHALEPATSYQATFNRGIANANGIPYTTRQWSVCLPAICARIAARCGLPTYAMGSHDYTKMLASVPGVKIIESTGSRGPTQLSPILVDLLEAAFTDRLAAFDARFPRPFTKF
ncbi:MAG TPA: hypothetical protein VNM43_05085 [Dehalococcoidia bacterium]|nr:hypothetical protein [Dehalococcoidia bacterium]